MNLDDFSIFCIVIGRNEVDSVDISGPLATLTHLVSSPEIIREFQQRVDISFSGYESTPEELFEIPEVRTYVYELNRRFPYWLYFLTPDLTGLQCVSLCFLPPCLTDEARQRIHPERLADLIDNCWGPALNQVCASASLPEDEADRILGDAITYFRDGPRLTNSKTDGESGPGE